jgi:galactokinase
MSIATNDIAARFHDHFGSNAEVVAAAPGRVNIIGEHTDYNHGYVLPMAIDRNTAIAGRRRNDGKLRAYANNLRRSAEIALDCIARNDEEPWLDYVSGVAGEIEKAGHNLTGADILILGDVPIGCGLSSSASIEMAALAFFETLHGFSLPGPEAAKLGRRVENDFLGVNSGIMDQSISRMGKEGHALFLDCRTQEFKHVPIAFDGYTLVIMNTGVTRGLTASKYNERVAECQEAVCALVAQTKSDGTHLRDFTRPQLEDHKFAMAQAPYRRARHVISENDRTIRACDDLTAGDAIALGKLMDESHYSLRDDYEVSCKELDAITAIAREHPACVGARMTGAGFGGCAIALVNIDDLPAFSTHVSQAYKEATGLDGDIIESPPAQGASGRLLEA